MTVLHLLVKIRRAEGVNACVTFQTQTRVYATITFNSTVYTTSSIEDMGKHPNWDRVPGGEAIWFPLQVSKPDDEIILELFNRNDNSIGKAILHHADLKDMNLWKAEDITLPVMVPRLISSTQKQFGKLVVAVLRQNRQATGVYGDLQLVLKGGYIKGITSFLTRLSEVSVKLSYLHTTYTTGTLAGQGDRFAWNDDDPDVSFKFLIDSRPTDSQGEARIVRIQVYNYQLLVGECWVGLEPSEGVEKTLLLKSKQVGTIDVVTEFIQNRSWVPRTSQSSGYDKVSVQVSRSSSRRVPDGS